MMADAARKKIIQVPGIGEVLLVKRPGTARLRISVSPRRGVVVSMPWMLPYAIAEKFLLSKRQWSRMLWNGRPDRCTGPLRAEGQPPYLTILQNWKECAKRPARHSFPNCCRPQ